MDTIIYQTSSGSCCDKALISTVYD